MMSIHTSADITEDPSPCKDRGDFCNANTTVDRAILDKATGIFDNIAADDGRAIITYQQLVSTAYAIAEELRMRGVSTGDRICLLCNRNLESLSAVLGVLMVGGVYVPVSPDYPAERIDYIVEDCDARVLVSDGLCEYKASQAKHVLVLKDVLDSYTKELSVRDTHRFARSADDPRRAAYILYTSGSTGRPKGVMVPHSALMNTLAWMAEAFEISEGETIPQKTPWGFTDSLWELFLPLLEGGRITLIDEETVRNPVALYHWFKKSRVVMTQFVPPALSTFLDEVCRQVTSPALPSLRWILNGGEELPRSLVDRWFKVFPNVGYANSYGMTESAIYATCYFMKGPPVWGMRRIPVGKPIANAEAYILGERGEVLGPDQVGEICVGGKSLMSGYWGRPDLTAKVLTPGPCGGAPLYRTGDYGTLRCDGEIAYLGRRDHQVKIRGMRVELGEVERVLMQQPCVKQAVVVAKDDGEAKYLVAFYAVHDEDPGEEMVMAYLAGILPSHMVPTRCIRLDMLPTTAHNKTDREQLLQLPLPARVSRCAENAIPGSIEEVIWQMWAFVLGADDFGVDDGFFDVGGNSLLLVRVYANLPADYQRVLNIPDLLHFPTVRSLAGKVREAMAGRPVAPEITNSTSRRDPAALNRLRGEARKKT